MRMTRDSYAREVWKVIEALSEGEEHISCPHENCEKELNVLAASLRAGTAVICPDHGVIFRE
jgi:nitrite reductase/ring-hydroxylating ferredoxin subunit